MKFTKGLKGIIHTSEESNITYIKETNNTKCYAITIEYSKCVEHHKYWKMVPIYWCLIFTHHRFLYSQWSCGDCSTILFLSQHNTTIPKYFCLWNNCVGYSLSTQSHRVEMIAEEGRLSCLAIFFCFLYF